MEEFKESFNVESLVVAITDIVSTIADDFKGAVVSEFSLEEKVVVEILKECISKRTENPQLLLGKAVLKKSTKKDDGVKDKCTFILTRGPRVDQSCGKPSTKGYLVCSSHKKALLAKGQKVPKKGDEEMLFKKLDHPGDIYVYRSTNHLVTVIDSEEPVSKANSQVIAYLMPLYETNLPKLDIKDLTEAEAKRAVEAGLKIHPEALKKGSE